MRRIACLAMLTFLVGAVAPTPASADNVTITAQVLAGTRTITTATITPLADVLRAASVDATLAVTVTETAVNGVNPWSTTVDLCGTDGAGAIDCGTKANLLVLQGDASTTIAGSNLAISGRSVTPAVAPAGATSTATSGSQDLSASRTIFATTGQNPLSLYTGTYVSSSTITLTPPSDATAGAYEGFLVVTLVS